MINLVNTTDKLQLITSTAAALDVVASWTDYSGTSTFSPGRSLSAISSATTTDVVAAPASSTTRNIKTVTIRNKDASLSSVVTAQYNANGTLYEIDKRTLNPGDQLQYLEGVGWFTTRNTNSPLANASVSDQTITAADAYVTGSGISFVGRIQAGSWFHWRICVTKTNASTATPIFNLRVGTAVSTSDTARATFTGPAQTAVVDVAWIDALAIVRTIGASGVLEVNLRLTHNLSATGFANIAALAFDATTASFDLTVAGSVMGWSFNNGASASWVIKSVAYDSGNLLT